MKLNKKQTNILERIIIAAVLFVVGLIVCHFIDNKTAKLIVSLVINLAAFIISGYDIMIKTGKAISHGNVFNENFLMCLAAVGAFCTGEFNEAVEVMIFFQVGQLFESYSVASSRNAISELMKIYPDEATVIRDGKEVTVEPDEVEVGETVLVKPGEKIPIDGVILKGESAVDTSALTGESVPAELKQGDEILSGSVNMSGVLEIKCTKPLEESTVSKILELVEDSTDNKSHAESFVTKFAKYYTPIVVIAAVLVAFVPPIIIAIIGGGNHFIEYIQRALIFLVVSCPCAIVISVPLAFFGTIGGASKDGILVKGSNFLEEIAKAETVVMDKTGTLTEGKFSVGKVCPNENEKISEDKLIEYAALAEGFSNHPIAVSLRNAYGKEIDKSRVSDYKEIAGFGVSAVIDGKKVFCGKRNLLKQEGVNTEKALFTGTIVYVSSDDKYLGYIGISDKIKSDSKKAVDDMRREGVKNIVMLTGDAKEIAENVGNTLGLDKVYSKLLPGDKVDRMKELKSETSKNGTVVFAGDGMNDAPVLASVDVGIAMGALGSDAAIEAADVVIMDDKPSKIALVMKYAKKCMNIVWANVIFALIIKLLIIVLAALGHATMLMGVFGDVGVSIICIINSMRTLRKQEL